MGLLLIAGEIDLDEPETAHSTAFGKRHLFRLFLQVSVSWLRNACF